MQNPLELICKLFQFQEFTLIKVNICVHPASGRTKNSNSSCCFKIFLRIRPEFECLHKICRIFLINAKPKRKVISIFFFKQQEFDKIRSWCKNSYKLIPFLFLNIQNSVKLFPTNTTVETNTSKNNLNVANQRKWKRSMLKYLCQYKQFYLQ